MSTIELFNPNIMPYGPLSNNYKNVMSIHKKNSNKYEIWNTVTQFIYTNMIDNPNYREIVKNTPIKDIYESYIKYLSISTTDIVAKSLYQGLLVKLENPSVQKILLNTGYGNILYASENNVLGVGVDGKGYNILGKYLMQIREEIRNKDITDANNLYKAYAIYFILENETFINNDLSGFLKNVMSFEKNYNNLDELINKYYTLLPTKSTKLTETLNSITTREYFEDMIKTKPELQKLLKLSINNPTLIIFYIRKEKLKSLKSVYDAILMNKIFDVYIDSIIKKRYPEISKQKYNIGKKQELDNLSYQDYDNLKNRIFVLYENKKLPKEILDEINLNLKIISKEEYDFSQTFNILEIPDEQEPTKFTKEIKIYTGSPSANYISDLDLIKENSFQILSPVYYTGMLKINELYYPTVSHYITANLLASLSNIGNLKEAQKYILKSLDEKDWNKIIPQNWIDYKEIYKKFSILSSNDNGMKLRYFAQVALDKKFENLKLQNILLQTENKLLLWTDKNDGVLGIGNGSGENFVGKYLMTLRDNYFKLHTEDEFNIVKENTLIEIIESDKFINDWVKMRIKDFINIAKSCNMYTKKISGGDDLTLNDDYLKIVLDSIYPQCVGISSEDTITLDIPLFFINIVLENIKSSIYSPGIISLLWVRIISMLYFIMKSLDNPTLSNIRNFIIKVQDIVSLQNNNVNILDLRKDNCIISAIINILLGIEKYNKEILNLRSAVKGVIAYDKKNRFNKDPTQILIKQNEKIGKDEVELAISILLNINIKNVNIIQEKKANVIDNQKEVVEDKYPINEPEKIFDEEPVNTILVEEDKEYIDQEESNVLAEEDMEDEEDIDYADDEPEEPEESEEREDYFYDYGEIDGAEDDLDNKIGKLFSYIVENNLFNSTPDKIEIYYANMKNLSKFILSALDFVNQYNKINFKTKNNRINFFSQC